MIVLGHRVVVFVYHERPHKKANRIGPRRHIGEAHYHWKTDRNGGEESFLVSSKHEAIQESERISWKLLRPFSLGYVTGQIIVHLNFSIRSSLIRLRIRALCFAKPASSSLSST